MKSKITRREAIKIGSLGLGALVIPFPINALTKLNLMTDQNNFDVIIIGGSYAGLSAAMALGRSLRNTLIIDSGKACNRFSPHSHNFLTQDGSEPGEISQKGKQQVLSYKSVKFYEGLATKAQKIEEGFKITTEKDKTFTSKKLIIASGLRDLLPNIKGFAACWGVSLVHCPYCHGYEIRDKKTAIMASSERAFHLAALVRNLSKEVSIISTDKFEAEQMKKLEENSVQLINKEVQEIKHKNGQIEKIVFNDGSSEAFEAAYASIPFAQSSLIAQELDCRFTESGLIEVNPMFQTSEAGIYACGDNCSPLRSVANAVYGGNVAGAMLNNELTMENF